MLRFGLIVGILFLLIYFIQAPNVNSQSVFDKHYGLNQVVRQAYSPYQENQENVLIILDSSYSMEEKIGNERKIDIAKRIINQTLSQLSPNVWVGLRIYGHKNDFFGINSCKASELKVGIGPNNQDFIRQELMKIKPVGWTPITYSLEQAIKYDFNRVSGKKRIILVSDGMETCNGSPCDYAVEMVKKNIDVKIDVIGFLLDEQAALSQLKCTALATKGKFYVANSASELADSLSKSLNVTKEVQGVILNK